MSASAMDQYLQLMRTILTEGIERDDRTGTGTLSVFGYQMRFDLRRRFPAVTTKKLHWPSIIHELLWFVSGETNIRYLQENGVRIWNEWADEDGELGPVYGKQWRRWEGNDGEVIDQLQRAVDLLRTTPESRRIVVSAWNAGELEDMALMPCHALFQFHVSNGELSCQLYQRSADVFLGVPFNISCYSLLTCMVAQVTGLKLGEFIHTIGDAHLYRNHLDQARQQVGRTPLESPLLRLNPDCREIDDFGYDDIKIEEYVHHEHIKAPISV